MKSKILPPGYFFIFLLLQITINYLYPVTVYTKINYTGIVFIVFGVYINMWSDGLFKKKNMTVKPYKKPKKIEVSGPYKISRHPMYLGMAAVLFGVAVLLGNLLLIVFPILFVLVMEFMFIPYEEKNLEKCFGRKYRDYKKKVRKWI